MGYYNRLYHLQTLKVKVITEHTVTAWISRANTCQTNDHRILYDSGYEC